MGERCRYMRYAWADGTVHAFYGGEAPQIGAVDSRHNRQAALTGERQRGRPAQSDSPVQSKMILPICSPLSISA
jgi:hypothetical protein